MEDLIGSLGPKERFGVLVGVIDIALDGGFELAGAAKDPAAELLLGEGGEPSFHQIQPRGARGREVKVKPWTLGQ